MELLSNSFVKGVGGFLMFTKFKAFFKGKEYKTIESYSEGEFEIQVKEDEEGAQMVSLRNLLRNQIVEITKKNSMIEHVIRDSDGTIKIEIPISIYKKVIDRK